MENVEIITLEDGLDYVIGDKITLDNITYVYLTEEETIENFCVRKIKLEDSEEYLVPLDNEEEFSKAINAYSKKHRQN